MNKVDFLGSVALGVILEKTGGAGLVKRVRLKGGSQEEGNNIPEKFAKKLQASFFKAWGDFRLVLVYLFLASA